MHKKWKISKRELALMDKQLWDLHVRRPFLDWDHWTNSVIISMVFKKIEQYEKNCPFSDEDFYYNHKREYHTLPKNFPLHYRDVSILFKHDYPDIWSKNSLKKKIFWSRLVPKQNRNRYL